jgi:hypothetical protein
VAEQIPMFESLLVDSDNSMASNFLEVQANRSIQDTNATFSCHMVRIRADGNNRTNQIAKMVACKIVDYSIPKSKRIEAKRYFDETESTSKILELEKEAKSLFSDIKNAGECGEILLYIFANSFLKIPQVLCKMPLKTSPRVHYHGVDGLHAKFDKDNNRMLLYWGESKIYSDLQKAFTECFDSISKMVLSDGSSGAPAERDLQLFRDNIDFDSKELESLVLTYLDPENENSLNLVHCGMCLIGFDEAAYSKVTEYNVKAELETRIESWASSIKGRLSAHKVDKTIFHIFLIPFPSAEAYRAAFLKELGI